MQQTSARTRKKVIMTDIAGVILVIASGLLGWLPGPGGMPLLFAGLSLLASNHEKPNRLLQYLKKHGFRLVDIFFPNDKQIQGLWDLYAFVALLFGVYTAINFADTLIMYPISYGYMVTCVLAFYYNRKRNVVVENFFRSKFAKK